jgi:hypothetical protein
MLRRLLVELACLSCGELGQLQVDDLHRLPPLPGRCQRCGGSVLATSASLRWIADPAVTFDWSDGSSRRGRPVKSQQAHP